MAMLLTEVAVAVEEDMIGDGENMVAMKFGLMDDVVVALDSVYVIFFTI